MPAGTTLDFVSRGCWRDVIARKGFASCFWWAPWALALVLSSWGAKDSAYWAPGALLQCTVTSNTQQLVASPDSPPAVNGFPPLGWFHSGVLLARFFPITAWQFLVRFLYAPWWLLCRSGHHKQALSSNIQISVTEGSSLGTLSQP